MNGDIDLEKFVFEWRDAGYEWVEAKLKADQLEDDQASFLSALKNDLDDGKTSEAKLDRLAKGSKEYRDFITGMVTARRNMLRLKVRFDGLDKLYEAKRSAMAFERAKIEKSIVHVGR